MADLLSPDEGDAWVRLTDYEAGGDAYWHADPDHDEDFGVYDAEGDTVATCTSRAAAVAVAAALNRLCDLFPDDHPDVLAARLRRSNSA